MRKSIVITTLLFSFCLLLITTKAYATDKKGNKFVGVKSCSTCHKTEKQGEQLKIWETSGHAKAYETLKSEEANKIAAEKGFSTKAVETKECLVCHATGYDADAALLDKKFNIEEGVQCETCHGAGSEYKSMKTMKDHAASVAAGMTEYKSDKEIEKQCVTCHNENSPTYKEFKFTEMWEKIKHPVPGK